MAKTGRWGTDGTPENNEPGFDGPPGFEDEPQGPRDPLPWTPGSRTHERPRRDAPTRREPYEPPRSAGGEVVITAIRVPFWGLVEFYIRAFFASLVAGLLIVPVLFVLAFVAAFFLAALGVAIR